MKRLTAVLTVFLLALSLAAACAEPAPAGTEWTTEITARFASVEEGREMMRGRTLFHEQISEDILPFFLQRRGGTLEEYVEYSAEQVMPFMPGRSSAATRTSSRIRRS